MIQDMQQKPQRGAEVSDIVRHRGEYLLLRVPGQPAESVAVPESGH